MNYIKKRNNWKFLLVRNVILFITVPLLFPSFVFAEIVTDGNLSYSVNPVSFKKNDKGLYKLEVVQPYSFKLKTVQKSMASMAYQTRLLAWSKKKRVFSNNIIKYLAPLIVKQFTIANENQTLVFRVEDKYRKALIKGDTFFTKKGLHWRFTALGGKGQRLGEYSAAGDSMRLVPRGNQIYKERNRYKNLKEHFPTWIIFPGIRPVSSRIIASPSPKRKSSRTRAAAPTSAREIQKRLEILKQLREDGAIDDREYKRKRKEILRNF